MTLKNQGETKAESVLRQTKRMDGLNKLSLILTDYMMEIGMFTTCLNCDHWQNEPELCKKFNARPPAKVIVVGCEEHSDCIPF